MKGSSRRLVLVLMNLTNSNKFMVLFYKHVANINRAFKNIKSNTMADFIQANHRELIITTNKLVFTLELNIIKKYLKNVDVIDSNDIIASRLPQSKSYLKILKIPYLIKNTNVSISSDITKRVLQSTYIFNNVVLTSKLRIIKAFHKLDIVVI